MHAFELHGVLKTFISLDMVRQARQLTDGNIAIDVSTEGGRSQVVIVSTDADKIYVFSDIGPVPDDRVALRALLTENVDGCYSRAAVVGDRLVQVYRYPIDQLEPKELALAMVEVARFADLYERKYFGGIDRG